MPWFCSFYYLWPAEGDVFSLEFQFYAGYETAAGHRIAAYEFVSAIQQVLGGHIYAERKRAFDSECLGKGQVQCIPICKIADGIVSSGLQYPSWICLIAFP